jgi:hypothetical protein
LPGGSQQLATNPTRPKIEGLAGLFLKVEDLLVAEVGVTKTQRLDVNLSQQVSLSLDCSSSK